MDFLFLWTFYHFDFLHIDHGTVTLNSGINELTLEFTTVTNVQSIRIYVTKSNLLVVTPFTNHYYLYLREIIPEFFGKF